MEPMPSCVPMGMIGFALSGAAIFNALDGQAATLPRNEFRTSVAVIRKCAAVSLP